ncbi:hypothetical protein [Mycolicibacterium hippocampi]|uniref:hypothetical protein n=1 Tax=Mycolicibacterium hippocampi TaxID=659824 RepID=UPI0013D1C3D9|nr:hypothetical protein [Mycolicibacterium hippocampi]
MRYTGVGYWQRRRAVVALLLAFWVVVIGAEWALPGLEPHPPHAPHPIVADSTAHLAPDPVDHSHISSGSTPRAPDTFAEAVLPRGTTALVALGLVAAVAAAATLWQQAALATIRGPPRRVAVNMTGRATLTRLCIARR